MQLATSYNIAMWYFYINACKENIKVTKVEIELIYHTVGIKINLSTYVKYRAIFHKKKSKIVCLVSRHF